MKVAGTCDFPEGSRMSHRELVSVGAAWWVGMGRKNQVLSSPGLLEAGNAFGCCHCCFAPVFGAGVSLSLALREKVPAGLR